MKDRPHPPRPTKIASRLPLPNLASLSFCGQWRRWLAGAIGLLAIVVIGWFFLRARAAKGMVDPELARREGRPIPVRTALAEDADVETVIGATAITLPSFTAAIRIPPTGGLSIRYVPPVTDMVVKAVHVQEGDYVLKDQLLFETDIELYKEVLQERITAVDAATAQYERAKLSVEHNAKVRKHELDSAEAEIKFRTQDLTTRSSIFEMARDLELGKQVSRIEYLESKSKYEQAIFDLAEAKRRFEWAKDAAGIGPYQDKEEVSRALKDLELARIDCEETRRGVERSKIRSPIDGILDGKSDIVPGQTVEVTSSLARVFQIDPIHVRLDFPQERIDEIKIGQPVDIVLDSFRNETFTGKVLRTSAQVNLQLRVLPVIVEVKNPYRRILPGISGYARLRSTKKTLTVPAAAVIQHASKGMVFRVTNGKAELREVKLGSITTESGAVSIADGLKRGDEVVVYHSSFYRHWGEITRLDAYLKHDDLVDSDWRRWVRRD